MCLNKGVLGGRFCFNSDEVLHQKSHVANTEFELLLTDLTNISFINMSSLDISYTNCIFYPALQTFYDGNFFKNSICLFLVLSL